MPLRALWKLDQICAVLKLCLCSPIRKMRWLGHFNKIKGSLTHRRQLCHICTFLKNSDIFFYVLDLTLTSQRCKFSFFFLKISRSIGPHQFPSGKKFKIYSRLNSCRNILTPPASIGLKMGIRALRSRIPNSWNFAKSSNLTTFRKKPGIDLYTNFCACLFQV